VYIYNVINNLVDLTDGFSGADLQGYAGFVVKEYWSSLLGKTNVDKNHVPLELFATLIDDYIKIKIKNY